MTEPRCDFSDLPVSSCAHCTGRTGDEPTDRAEIIRVWDAYYPGRCDWCGGEFDAGERVGRDEHESLVCFRHREVSYR